MELIRLHIVYSRVILNALANLNDYSLCSSTQLAKDSALNMRLCALRDADVV